MAVTEERMSRLELVLADFIAWTKEAIRTQKEDMEEFRRQAEADRRQAEVDRRQAEMDRQHWNQRWEDFGRKAEADREHWNQRWEDFGRRAEADREQSNQRFEEFRRQAEADRRYWNKRWGEQANQLGLFAESIVAPSLPRIAEEQFGMGPFTFIGERIIRPHKDDPGRSREFDMVIADSTRLLISETRSRPDADAANEFAEALREVFFYFPEYAGHKLIPVFSSLHLKEDLVKRLTRLKIYALQMSDDTMELINKEAVEAL